MLKRINQLFIDIGKLNIPGTFAVMGVFTLIVYLGYTGISKFITGISEGSFMLDVKKELTRVNHSDETKVIEYFYHQNKELTCKAMVEYLNWEDEKNENVIRLEVFPKFCLNDNKEMK